MLHGRMIDLCEQEADADTIQTLPRLLRIQMNINTKRLQHICTARSAGCRTVAMLRHSYRSSGRDDCRSCGDIEFMNARAARAAGIQQLAPLCKHLCAETAHRLCEAGDFFNGLPLIRSAVSSDPICAGEAAPSIIVPIISRACVRVRSLPSIKPAIPDCSNWLASIVDVLLKVLSFMEHSLLF